MTTEQKHTPEPWHQGISGGGIRRIWNKRGTALCQFGEGVDEAQEHSHNAEANAGRIVACVNLCTNLTDGAIDELQKAGGLSALLDAVEIFKVRRNELAEALRLVVRWYEDAGNADPDQSSPDSVELYGKAKAALAKLS